MPVAMSSSRSRLAETVEGAEHVVARAGEVGRKVVVGYILRHHPSWIRFIEMSHSLGKPLVMRMNLNQQSSGDQWKTHKNLMSSISPIVDCGVHYVDVMCSMTRSKPVRVSGIGARLSDELPEGKINYGQLQVTFEDGSVGWYEAGWGPMMSEVSFFVKDVVGPKGLRLDRCRTRPPPRARAPMSRPTPRPRRCGSTTPSWARTAVS